jgi:hypothetical protein
LDAIAARLGDRDPTAVLRETPLKLQAFSEDLTYPWDRPYREGGWTGGEIVAHLADQEIGFAFRLRQAVAFKDERHTTQPYDQDAWARPYAKLCPAVAVQAFSGLRAWNVARLATLELDEWLATYHHPERSCDESVDELVRFQAGHDLHHLDQLQGLLEL